MTMNELIKMTGSEEQAEYALEILLGQVKKDFVRMTVRAELASIETEIKLLEAQGYIVHCNGHYSVNWGKVHDGWHLSAEQEAARDEAEAKCELANTLIYRRNRTLSLIAVR